MLKKIRIDCIAESLRTKMGANQNFWDKTLFSIANKGSRNKIIFWVLQDYLKYLE